MQSFHCSLYYQSTSNHMINHTVWFISRGWICIWSSFCAVSFIQGAPIAGSAVDKVEEVVGYVSIGYPFGLMASILFGRHHKAILDSTKPKLFIMGTKDGFTSVKQLDNKLKTAKGRAETQLIEGASHFQMEGPAYDLQMLNLIVEFISSLWDLCTQDHLGLYKCLCNCKDLISIFIFYL